ARARSPSTGVVVALAALAPPPAPGAPAADPALDAALRRLVALAEAGQGVQRQLVASPQSALRALRDLGPRGQGPPGAAPLERALAGVAEMQQALDKQLNGIDVFLMRYDTALCGLDQRLAELGRSAGDRAQRRFAGVAAGLAAVALVAALAALCGA